MTQPVGYRALSWMGFVCIGALLPGLLTPGRAVALDYLVRADYEAEYTSNARRDETDETSDVIHRPGISATASHIGPATELNISYRYQRRIYQDDTFENESLTQGSAQATWHVRPERLSLFVSNNRRESRIRTEGESVPENLQVSSRTSAGATARADLLFNHYGTLTYTFTDIRAEETRTESSRHSLQAAYVIPLSPIHSIQLVGTGIDVDFDNPLAPDYESVTGSLDYDRTGPRTTLGASAGYTSIDRELSRDTTDGFVGSIFGSREFGADSRIRVSYNQSLQDNSLDAWRDVPGFDDEIIVGDTDLNEVFEQKSLSITYTTRLGVNIAELSAIGTRQTFEDELANQDEERAGASLSLTRPIRQSLQATAAVDYIRYGFDSDERNEDSYGASLEVSWDPTPRLALFGSIRYFEREGTTTAAGDIEDWQASIGLSYVLFGSERQ